MKKTLAACMLAIPFACLAADTQWTPQVNVQNADFVSGRNAVESGNWKAAVEAFSRAARTDPHNADVQNYLGYSYRQMDRMEEAFRHYNEALRLEPSHRGANEYIGWAYLRVKQLAKAEEHLARLERICGKDCEEVGKLSKGIAEYKAKNPH